MYTKLHKNPNSSIFSDFHDPAYAKLHKNQMLQFSLIFMTPGTRNLTKSNASIFSNFHDPGRYTKPHKNQMLQFSQTFMTPGTQNLTKIKYFNFLQLSWPRVHETSQKSNASIFSNFYDPGYTKPHKNQILQFSLIFMTPGRQNFTKIKCFNFLQFSWTRVDEISQNSNASISSNFYDPGYLKLQKDQTHYLWFSWPRVHETLKKNQILQFPPIFVTLGTRNFTKIKCFNFL